MKHSRVWGQSRAMSLRGMRILLWLALALPAAVTADVVALSDPAYAQINANIPADLRRDLRVRLASEEREQQEVLEGLIRGYLEGRFKV